LIKSNFSCFNLTRDFWKMVIAYQYKNGQSLVELCAGLVLAIPFLLLVMNGVAIGIGLQSNENTCREAARLAASGDPATAELRAKSIVSKANETKGWMTADTHLDSVKNVANPMSVQQSDGKTAYSSVEVSTTVCVHPAFLGAALYDKRIFTFSTTQRFPYTYVAPIAPSANSEPAKSSSN
jgi:hypothetical protein